MSPHIDPGEAGEPGSGDILRDLGFGVQEPVGSRATRECADCGQDLRYDGGIRAWGLLFCDDECADGYEADQDTYGEDPLGGAW
jgi:hypothetical protein